jgi:hypothetical protein
MMIFSLDISTGMIYNYIHKFKALRQAMYHINDKNYLTRTAHLDEKQLEFILDSWAEKFFNLVLPNIPFKKLCDLYCKNNGRPSIELRLMVGLTILQQYFDKSDDETIEAFYVNELFRHALNVYSLPEKDRHVCAKTLWTFRQLLINNNIDRDIFRAVSKHMAEVFDIDFEKQRLDSVHFKTNMKTLSRLGIFSTANKDFLRNLKKNHQEEFKTIDPSVVTRYLNDDPKVNGSFLQFFGQVKPSERATKLQTAAEDLYKFVTTFEGNKDITSMATYKILTRVLSEQCVIEEVPPEAGKGKPSVVIKKPKDIPSNSLQNPSDPDASFSGHKGQGFHAQLTESFTDNRDGSEKIGFNLITGVDVEGTHIHDGQALIPAIERAEAGGLKPDSLLADTAYGSDDNVQQAAALGVELISPAGGTDPEKDGKRLADFTFDENGDVTECPEGQKPWIISRSKKRKGKKAKETGNITAGFDKDKCSVCPFCGKCPVKISGDSAKLNYSSKDLRLSQRRAYEQTRDFKKKYSMRAGIEATNSELDRLTHAKKLRYRGLRKALFAISMKALGINIKRAAAFISKN